MLKRLVRQRRRIVLVTVLFVAAIAIWGIGNAEVRYFFKHQAGDNPTLFLVVFGLVVTVLPALFAALVVLLFPAQRRALEAATIALVIQAIVERSTNAWAGWEHYGVALWVVFFAVFYGLLWAMARDVLRGVGLQFTYRARASRRIEASQAALWAALAPTDQTMGSYWTRSLIRVSERPEWGRDAFEVHFRMGQFGTLVQRQDRRVWNWPERFEYAYRPVDEATGSAGASGIFGVTLSPGVDGKTEVELRHEIPALGFGTWSLLWLDDVARSEMDAVEARIRGKRDWSISGWQARKMAAA